MNKFKLNVDFTRLAKIAFETNKLTVSDFLIDNEKQIVKKISFFIEVK